MKNITSRRVIMNSIKLLSPSTTFGVIKFDLQSSKVISVNPVFKSFLMSNNINPVDLIRDIRLTLGVESAHVSIGGLEFLMNVETNDNTYSVYAHQIASLTKTQASSAMPMDELHKRRLLTLGEMTAGIIHDINNPLNIVNSGVELLTFFLEELEDENNVDPKHLVKIKDQISKIRSGTNRITEVSEGVRMLMRKDQLTFKEQDISKIITSSAACCISFLRTSGIEFNFKINESVKNTSLSCKESLLAQVFINLIKNSHDAIKDLAPHNKFIEFELSETVSHLVIKVKDGGKGVPLENRTKIFEPFFTTKQMGDGTGIGLSLCKQIVEAHGGWLAIDDKAQNTTFVMGLSKNLKS